jgi:hypothetical protein
MSTSTPAPHSTERDHTHYLDGREVACRHLTHCPAYCSCAVDACDSAIATEGPCPDCGRAIGWDGHPYTPCGRIVTRRGKGPNARVRAASLYAAWRAEGVPSFVTAHEAYRLSGGKVGRDGDHGATGGLNLSTVAAAVEGSR